MTTLYYTKEKKNRLERLLKEESKNPALNKEAHDIAASYVRFLEEICHTPENFLGKSVMPAFLFFREEALKEYESKNLRKAVEAFERTFKEGGPMELSKGPEREALKREIFTTLKNMDERFNLSYYLTAEKLFPYEGGQSLEEKKRRLSEHFLTQEALVNGLSTKQHEYVRELVFLKDELSENALLVLDKAEENVHFKAVVKGLSEEGILGEISLTLLNEAITDYMLVKNQFLIEKTEGDFRKATIATLLNTRLDVMEEIENVLIKTDQTYKSEYSTLYYKIEKEGKPRELADKEIIAPARVYLMEYLLEGKSVVDEREAFSREEAIKLLPKEAVLVSVTKLGSRKMIEDALSETKSEGDGKNDYEKKMEEIKQKLSDGFMRIRNSEHFRNYLTTMSRFHSYSTNNCMLINTQMPTATRVTSYNKWEELKRHVKKGERAITIIAPREGEALRRTIRYAEDGTPLRDKDGNLLMENKLEKYTYFSAVPVFDISQTEGKALPEICGELTFDVEGFETLKEILEEIAPVKSISYEDITDGANGYYYPKTQSIVVKSNMSEAQTIKTLLHEIAHAALGHGDKYQHLDQATKELQAESCAFVICSYLGIDTSDYSFEYLASWAEGKDDNAFKKQLEIIRKETDYLIGKIKEKLPKEKEVLSEELYKEGVYRIGVYRRKGALNQESDMMLPLAALKKEITGIDSLQYELKEIHVFETKNEFDTFLENLKNPKEAGGPQVTDVIVVNNKGKLQSFFVDDYGLSTLENFTGDERELKLLNKEDVENLYITEGFGDVTEAEVLALMELLSSRELALGSFKDELVKVNRAYGEYTCEETSLPRIVQELVFSEEGPKDEEKEKLLTSLVEKTCILGAYR